MSLRDALLAISRSEHAAARQFAADAVSDDPDGLLAAALSSYLGLEQAEGVYGEPSGFEDFVGQGGNPALYASTIKELGALHRSILPDSVLDIGCGDGRVTAAVVQPRTDVLLLEPSTVLLELAELRMRARTTSLECVNTGIQQLLDTRRQRWDLVQATYSLHTIDKPERLHVLAQLREHTDRLAVVEFDVPAYADHSVAHADYVIDRYEVGLAEYHAYPNVISDFLLPLLVGQFDPTQKRHTFEQPIENWKKDLLEAGWTDVETSPVAEYWWADAVLLDCR